MPLRVFPVAPEGRPTFGNDFGAPRSGGRTHDGNDVFAPEGTPVLAVDAGDVTFGTASLGGNVAKLRARDGVLYLYTHLSAFEGSARAVRAGDVIGYVGTTGNAAGTPPHVHFEIRPPGVGPVDPFDQLSAVAPKGAIVRLPGRPTREASSSSSGSGFVLLLLLALAFSSRKARRVARDRRARVAF